MRKSDLFIISLFSLIVLLAINSCKEDPVTPPPPPPDPVILNDTITLSLSDVTHRSLTINVSATQNNPKSGIKLFRISNSIETLLSEYSIDVKDTAIIDDNNGAGLELNTEYSYYAVRIDSLGEKKDTSNIVSGMTLNATTHEYTWEEFIIGEFQSVLFDVWGTDENNVWAVGSYRFNDTAYGVIKWDGNSWKPEKKIGGLQAIYGFSNNDIWAVGGGVWYYNGAEWEAKDSKSIGNQGFPLDSILYNNKPYTVVWGSSSNNMYFGTERGKIIHWNGKKAEIVYSYTNILLTDVQGYNSDFILACGSALAPPNIMLKYDGISWERITELSSNRLVYSTYIITSKEYYMVGEEILRFRNGVWINLIPENNSVMQKIRGNKKTGEIVVVGHFSTLYHFNGIDWKKFQFTLTQYTPIYSTFLINNKIFAVGSFGNQARIIIGTRK